MTWFLVWFTPLVVCLVCSAQITITPPGIISIEENLSDIFLFNGTYILRDVNCAIKTLQGQSLRDPSIEIGTSLSISAGACTFNVTLLSPVDYEKPTTMLEIKVILRLNCTVIESQETATKVIFITNVLDTPPAFINSTYSVSIRENHILNTAVIVNIQATDADVTDSVKYTVNFSDKQQNLFQVRFQNNPEILDIYLISPLDFEQQHVHHFTITAIDTVGMNSTCDVFVKVINIQDTPPAFTAIQYNGRIIEEAKVGSAVLTVSAADGDSVFTQDQWEGTSANQIYYSIISGDVGMFGINSSTGEIITIRELDIDSNTNVTNGLVIMTIMAEELNTSMEPQFGAISVTVLAMVQVEDANDNRPQFNSQSFTGSIRADAVLGELITIEGGGYISVFDIDQAPSNNHFSLHIEKDGKPWDVFKPNIEAQYAYASVMIQLNKNNSILDLGDTHIKFQIVAQEYGSSSQNLTPTKSEMSVWVKARVVAATPSDPIINLPLSTSDIIVFIVGLLLLLNVGLTIFICYALRGGHVNSKSVLNRNSKYYVSNRNKTNPEIDTNPYTSVHNDELSNTNVSKMEISQSAGANMQTTRALEQTLMNTNITISGIEQAQNTETSKQLPTDIRASQIKSQAPLMSTLKENDSFSNHNVKHLKSSSSQDDCKRQIAAAHQDELVNGQPNLGQGLSNFAQKVQQKLANGNRHNISQKDGVLDLQHEISASLESSATETPHISSNRSSSSETRTDDVVPLIKSSPVKFQSNLENLLAHKNSACTADLPVTSVTVKESDERNSNNWKFTLPSVIETEALVSDSSRKEEDKVKKSVIFNTEDKRQIQKSSFLPDRNIRSDSKIYPTAFQITQTGVPPVALALPQSTGTLNINKVPHVGIINPVFGTSLPVDKLTANSSLVSPPPGLASTVYYPQQPPMSVPSTTQKVASETVSSTVSPKESITGKQKPVTQNIPNSQSHITSESENYINAAKNMLASVKQDKQTNQMEQPKTATITEDVGQRQKQNTPGEKLTSF